MKVLFFSLLASAALVSTASAADAVFVQPAPAAVVQPTAYDWTGLYLGAFAGVTTGDSDFSADAGAVGTLLDASISASGALGGAQIGYDWQVGQWVFGAVADIAASGHEASIEASSPILGGSAEASSELKYLGTVRARLGYAAFDRALIYAHGGFAYGETDQTVSAGGTTLFDDSTSKAGWTIGAGLEYALTDHLSFQTEYSYVDLGEDDVFSEPIAGPGSPELTVSEDLKFHAVKAAINYRF